MFELIERLRQKPEKTKRKIAFFTAFTFTVVIFLFWIMTVYPSFKEQSEIDKKVKSFDEGPTSSLSSIFSNSIGEIKNKVSSLKDFTSSFTTDKEYYVASTTTSTITGTSTEELNTETEINP